jgi:hypothetical protein
MIVLAPCFGINEKSEAVLDRDSVHLCNVGTSKFSKFMVHFGAKYWDFSVFFTFISFLSSHEFLNCPRFLHASMIQVDFMVQFRKNLGDCKRSAPL